MRGEPDAGRKSDDRGHVDDETVEPQPLSTSLGRNDRGHEGTSYHNDDREAGAPDETDRENGGHRVREREGERRCAEEGEAGGEGKPVSEARNDARRRQFDDDGGEHEGPGCESGTDAGCADGGGVLRYDGQEEIEADHRPEAGGAEQDHGASEERRRGRSGA